jgi:hypothetical protein
MLNHQNLLSSVIFSVQNGSVHVAPTFAISNANWKYPREMTINTSHKTTSISLLEFQ